MLRLFDGSVDLFSGLHQKMNAFGLIGIVLAVL